MGRRWTTLSQFAHANSLAIFRLVVAVVDRNQAVDVAGVRPARRTSWAKNVVVVGAKAETMR